MRRTSFLTAVLLVVLCSTAEAKLPAPRPPDLQVLRSFGLQVQWPAAGTTRVASAYPIALQVTGVGRASRPRRVPLISLLRVDAVGRKVAVVVRRRVAAGRTFRVPMPSGPADAFYQLRLDVGNRHYWSWLAIGARGSAPRADCEASNDVPGATLAVSPTSARTAAVLSLTLRNTGTACLGRAFGVVWQRRLADGTFQTVPSRPPPRPGDPVPGIPAIGFDLLPPGETQTLTETIWTGLAPGAYRLKVGIASVEFTILS